MDNRKTALDRSDNKQAKLQPMQGAIEASLTPKLSEDPAGFLGAGEEAGLGLQLQAPRLADNRFQTAQRQKMAFNVANVQGNQNFARIMQAPKTPKPRTPSPFQAKMMVSPADDVYEREADSVADSVMRMPASGSPGAPPDEQTPTSVSVKSRYAAPSAATSPIHNKPALQLKIDGFFLDDIGLDDDSMLGDGLRTDFPQNPGETNTEEDETITPEQQAALDAITGIKEKELEASTTAEPGAAGAQEIDQEKDTQEDKAAEESVAEVKKEIGKDKARSADKGEASLEGEPASEIEGKGSEEDVAVAEGEQAAAPGGEQPAEDKAQEAVNEENATAEKETGEKAYPKEESDAEGKQPASSKAQQALSNARQAPEAAKSEPAGRPEPAAQGTPATKAAMGTRYAPAAQATPVTPQERATSAMDQAVRFVSRLVNSVQAKGKQQGFGLTPEAEGRIESLEGHGRPLRDEDRSFFEERMNADFSNVRVHTGADAVQLSRDINARAFTVGNNIAFNSGEYRPDSDAGKRLLTHELAHTIQQGAAGTRKVPGKTAQQLSRKAVSPGTVQAQQAPATGTYTVPKGLIAAPLKQTAQSTKFPKTTSPAKEAQKGQKAANPQPQEKKAVAETMHLDEVKKIPVDFNVGEFVLYLVDSVSPLIGKAPETVEAGTKFSPADSDVNQARQVFKDNTRDAGKEVKDETNKAPDSSKVTMENGVPFPPPSLTFEPQGIDMDKAFPPQPETPKNPELEKNLAGDTAKEVSGGEISEKDIATWQDPKANAALDAKKGIQAAHESAEIDTEQKTQELLGTGKAEGKTEEEKAYDAMASWEDYRKKNNFDLQGKGKTKTEQRHTAIAAQMDKIYADTKKRVASTLATIENNHIPGFDRQVSNAKDIFTQGVRNDVRRERGFFGTLKDKIFGRSEEVKQKIAEIHATRKRSYLIQVRGIVQSMGLKIGQTLKLAKQHIAAGRESLESYIAKLPEEDRKVADEMKAHIFKEFDGLDKDVEKASEEALNHIATTCNEVKNGIDESLAKLEADNQGLLGKLTNAFMPVLDMFKQMKDMLLSVGKLGSTAIKLFFKDPGKFLKGAFAAVKEGFQAIPKNFGNLAKSSLMTWLVSKIGGSIAGKFGAGMGKLTLASIVMSVLGLNYSTVQSEAIQSVGAEAVSEAESSELKNLKDDPQAMWKMAQQQAPGMLGEIINMVKQIVLTNLLTKGIMTIVSMLVPATGILKIVQTIIRFLQWFFTGGGLMLGSFINMILAAFLSGAQGNVARGAIYVLSMVQDGLPLLLDAFMMLVGVGAGAIGGKIKKGIKKFGTIAKKVSSKIMGKFKAFAKLLQVKKRTLKLARKVKKGITQKAKAAGGKMKQTAGKAINSGKSKVKKVSKRVTSAADKFTRGAITRGGKKLRKKLDAENKKLEAANKDLNKAKGKQDEHLKTLEQRKAKIEQKIARLEKKLAQKDQRAAKQLKTIEAIPNQLKQLKQDLAKTTKSLQAKTQKLVGDVKGGVKKHVVEPVKKIKSGIQDLYSKGKNKGKKVVEWGSKKKEQIKDLNKRMENKADQVKADIQAYPGKVKKSVKDALKSVWDKGKKSAAGKFNKVKALATKVKNIIGKPLKSIHNKIKTLTGNSKFKQLKNFTTKVKNVIGKPLKAAYSKIQQYLKSLTGSPKFQWMKDAVTKPLEYLMDHRKPIKDFFNQYRPTHAVKPPDINLSGMLQLGDDYQALIPFVEKLAYANGDPTKQQNVVFSLKLGVEKMFGGKYAKFTGSAFVQISGTVDVLANDGSQYVAGMIVFGGNLGGSLFASYNKEWIKVIMLGHKYRGAGQIAYHWWKSIRNVLRTCLNKLPFVDIPADDAGQGLANPSDAEDPAFQNTKVKVVQSGIQAGDIKTNGETWVDIDVDWTGKNGEKGVALKERQVTIALSKGYSGLIKELYYYDPDSQKYKVILYDFYLQGRVGTTANAARIKNQAARLFSQQANSISVRGTRGTLMQMFWSLRNSDVLPPPTSTDAGFDVQIRWRADVEGSVFENEGWAAGQAIRCIPRQCDVNLFSRGAASKEIGPIKGEMGYEGWTTVDQYFYPNNINHLIERFAGCMWRGDGRAEKGDQGVQDALALLADQGSQVDQMMKNIGRLAARGEESGIYAQVKGSVKGFITQDTVNKFVARCIDVWKENGSGYYMDSTLLEYLTLNYYNKRAEWEGTFK